MDYEIRDLPISTVGYQNIYFKLRTSPDSNKWPNVLQFAVKHLLI